MTGMTLNELKQTMTDFDEIEFFYRGEQYDFQKEPGDDSQIKISVWHVKYNPECVYSVTILKGDKNFVDALINAKIFPDGKFVEAEADIDVEFFA
ncbi:MAG: hypothetical protein IKG61_09335 [Selenomonadaceae bacterium]|nr:hypothetical protein [Selenomonadaceae bacterium]